ncbi:MAG: DUF2298 domain-containing protein [Lachnospiraceae bacterium]|nr:DUF2298 domain-containing protein [Lachnospiraceae bacterium]
MTIISWYIGTFLTGLLFWPVTRRLVPGWRDGGWILSKALGPFFMASLLWLLNCLHLVPFGRAGALLTMGLIPAVMALAVIIRQRRSGGGANAMALSGGTQNIGNPSVGREESAKSSDEVRKADRATVRSGLCPNGISTRFILIEEMMFLGLFLLCVYIVGFKPEIYGTEKFMDYGFITGILRNDWMPFEDIWFAGKGVNYYYGGQYITAYLVSLTGVGAGWGYNLMRAFLTTMTFMLPFSAVYEAMRYFLTRDTRANRADRVDEAVSVKPSANTGKEVGVAHKAKAGAVDKTAAKATQCGKHIGRTAILTGLLAGMATAFAGNMHYVIKGLFGPLIARLTGSAYNGYWFPSSTRYIGYDPDLPDKTIHEFPSYSSVLGDLHAHYINVIFALAVIALLIAWVMRRMEAAKQAAAVNAAFSKEAESDAAASFSKKDKSGLDASFLKMVFLDPVIIVLGLMIGLFRWTNFWDFPIYMVVAGAVILFTDMRVLEGRPGRVLVSAIGRLMEMMLLGTLAALPFTLSFDMISSKILPVTSHTMLKQLVILWGLPTAVVVLFFVLILADHRRRKGEMSRGRCAFLNLLREIPAMDLVMLIFGAAGLGLVLMPELIYVEDIYGGAYYRSNTMFKMTYQAFVLLAIVMAYAVVRLVRERKKWLKVPGILLLVLLLLTGGYTVRAVKNWFGEDLSPAARISTDASLFIRDHFPTDEAAVKWLEANVSGTPVILEAQDTSYTDCGRISAATGLPTVLGWYVHEWLWRSDPQSVAERSADVRTIYTSDSPTQVQALIEKYNISYIYIGEQERTTYGTINDTLLQSLGEVAYSDGEHTYIMAVNPGDE